MGPKESTIRYLVLFFLEESNSFLPFPSVGSGVIVIHHFDTEGPMGFVVKEGGNQPLLNGGAGPA